MLQERGFTVISLRKFIGAGLAIALFSAPLVSAEENARGAELFNLCSQCHGPEAEGNRLFLAPAIAGMGEWYVAAQLQHFKSGARGTHFDDISGMRMRPMALSLLREGDIEAVSKYVSSLPRTKPAPEVEGGNPETGKVLYGVCVACHGANGEGNQVLNAPALIGVGDWYIADSLRRYKQGVRGSHPGNPNGAIMRGMVGSLTTDQAILDVVAFITMLDKTGE